MPGVAILLAFFGGLALGRAVWRVRDRKPADNPARQHSDWDGWHYDHPPP